MFFKPRFTSFLIFIIIGSLLPLSAATIRSNTTGGGAWGNGGSWTGGVSPGPGDDVVIRAGDVIQLNQDISVASLTVKGHFSSTTTLQVTTGNTLTVNGNIIMEAKNTAQTVTLDIDGEINTVGATSNLAMEDDGFADFTVNIDGSGSMNISNITRADITALNAIININATITTADYFRFSIDGAGSSCQVNVNSTLTANNSGGSGNVFRLHSANGAVATDLNVDLQTGSVLALNGSIQMQSNGGHLNNTAGVGSIVRHTGGALLIDPKVVYDNVDIQNTQSLAGSITTTNLLGDLMLSGSGQLNTNGNNITLAGNVTSTGQIISNSGSGDIVTFEGTAAQSLSGNNDFDILVINNSSGVDVAVGTSNIFSTLDIRDGAFTNSGGTVNLVSTATRTANLIEMGAGASCGTITANRYISSTVSLGWRHFTSPIQGTTLIDFQEGGGSSPNGIYTYGYTGSNAPSAGGQFSTYTYDAGNVPAAGNFELGWENATNASNTLSPFFGTIFYSGGNGTSGGGSRSFYDLSVTGTPYQGSVTINSGNSNMVFTAGGNSSNNWNFVGNPYPCTIDWSDVQASSSNVAANAFIFSPGGGYQSTATFSDQIASFQSFWIQSTGASPSLTFQESDKVDGQRAIQKSMTYKDRKRLYVNMKKTNDVYYNVAVLEFNDQATAAPLEDGYDAMRFASPYPIPECSFLSQGVAQEVDSRSMGDSSVTIPMETKIHKTTSGHHTFVFWTQNIENACITVYDKLADTTLVVEGADTLRYTAFITDTVGTNRFEINVQPTLNEQPLTHVSCNGKSDGEAPFVFPAQSQATLYQGQSAIEQFTGTGAKTFSQLEAGKYELRYAADACSEKSYFFSIQEPIDIEATIDKKTPVQTSVGTSTEFVNASQGATEWIWDFGNGDQEAAYNATYVYSKPGSYVVKMKASFTNGECQEVARQNIEVSSSTGFDQLNSENAYLMRQDEANIYLEAASKEINDIGMLDLTGKQVKSAISNPTPNSATIKLPSVSGVYILNFKVGQEQFQRKFTKP